MKKAIQGAVLFGLLTALNLHPSTAHAQGTAFTYQGRLNDGANPATGSYDLRFGIYSAAAGGTAYGTLTNAATGITNGLFTVALDFGSVFDGTSYWLEIGVRTNGTDAFTTLSQRQPVTPTPYAVYAGTVNAAGISGTYGNAVTLSNAANRFTGNGSGLANVNATSLGGQAVNNFWNTGGNGHTTDGLNFIGTTDNQALDFKVSNVRALRLEPTALGAPNLIGGSAANGITSGGMADTIAGGDGNSIDIFGDPPIVATANHSVISGGYQNHIQNADLGIIAGGDANIITNAPDAVISGGQGNFIGDLPDNGGIGSDSLIAGGANNRIFHSHYSSIGGGAGNVVTNANGGLVGGGEYNTIYGFGGLADTIAGGEGNIITNGGCASIGGGYLNVVGDGLHNSTYATIPGGYGNYAVGAYSFAAGYFAQATNQGAFVWSDSLATPFGLFSSAANNEFAVRARGGVRLVTDGAGLTVDGLHVNVPASSLSSGAHSIIAGGIQNTNYADNATISGGAGNQILLGSDDSTIAGGMNNQIGPNSSISTIGGGSRNQIQTNSLKSTIAGGENNHIYSYTYAATIGGGKDNLVNSWADESTIGGGVGNKVTDSAADAAIGGGANNLVQSSYGSVGGGSLNQIQNNSVQSTIAGGWGNQILAACIDATIGGGDSNQIGTNSENATIAGGYGNLILAYAHDSTIGGGNTNLIGTNAIFTTISGGKSNAGLAQFATVGGGGGNTASGWSSTVGGGGGYGSYNNLDGNVASGAWATISGGSGNVASGYGSTVGGGVGYDAYSIPGNTASGNISTIAGGYANLAAGYVSSIGGGAQNSIGTNATYSTIGGGSLNQIMQNNPFTASTGSTIAGGGGNRILPDTSYASIGGGSENLIQTNSFSSTIAGGCANQILEYSGYASIGGGYNNQIGTNANASTISGGTNNIIGNNCPDDAIGGGAGNFIESSAGTSTIGGGSFNSIRKANNVIGIFGATIAGGYYNVAMGLASTVGGGGGYFGTYYGLEGDGNRAYGDYSTIGGGYNNKAVGYESTIGGGQYNRIGTNATSSTIGGGNGNVISNNVVNATIPGGFHNTVGADMGFAAGGFASANHQGSFVWSDSSGANISTAPNQFLISASGGVGIGTNAPQASLHVAQNDGSRPQLTLDQNLANDYVRIRFRNSGKADWDIALGGPDNSLNFFANGVNVMKVAANGNITTAGTVNGSSDRNVKENFKDISAAQILAKVAALPISEWNYKQDTSATHIGPMAQDFYAAFAVGPDDKHIAVVDESGVALAAIQGLNQKLEARSQELASENAALKSRLEKLEQIITRLTEGAK